MPSRVDKVRGHAEHVLDAFLRLRATYAVLDPLLFNSEVRGRWTSGAGVRGRETLVGSLLFMCVLEASKLTTDGYSQTPSLRNLDVSLDDQALVTELRNSYSEWNLPSNAEDPDVIRLLERMEAHEKTEREAKFNRLVSEFRQGWSELVGSNTLGAFKTLRNKVIAHTEVRHENGKYRAYDVASLGLRFADLRTLVHQLEPLVDRANLVFRASSFDFEDTRRQLTTAANHFWEVKE